MRLPSRRRGILLTAMSVIACSNCGREVSTSLITCPGCNTPVGYLTHEEVRTARERREIEHDLYDEELDDEIDEDLSDEELEDVTYERNLSEEFWARRARQQLVDLKVPQRQVAMDLVSEGAFPTFGEAQAFVQVLEALIRYQRRTDRDCWKAFILLVLGGVVAVGAVVGLLGLIFLLIVKHLDVAVAVMLPTLFALSVLGSAGQDKR